MEIFQVIYFTAQPYSCPKDWESEQSLLAFSILISKQNGIQSIDLTLILISILMILLRARKTKPAISYPCGKAWHSLCVKTISIH